MSRETNVAYQFGPYLLDPTNQRLIYDRLLVDAPVEAIQVLEALLDNAGEVVTRQYLAQRVWPNITIDSEEIDWQVANLKRLLHDNKENPYVRRISDQGYRFEGSVTQLLAASISDEIGEAALDVKLASEAEEPAATPKRHMKLGAMVGTALAAVIVTTLGVWAWHFMRGASANVSASADVSAPDDSQSVEPVSFPHQVAVLPLGSLGGSPDDDRFVRSLTESIIGALGKDSQLKVVSFAAVQKYAKSGVSDPLSAGHELGARTIVVGMAQQLAGRAQVTVQMLSTQDGSKIWSGAFAGSADDIAGLSAQISQEIGKRVPGSESSQ